MSDTLTQLVARVQGLFSDDGTRFSTAVCTAAIRQALAEVNRRAPVFAGTLIDAVTDQYEYELSDEDADALEVKDVLLRGDDGNELDLSLLFDWYIEDERVFFRLREAQTEGDTLIVRYTKNHTVSGLDSEVESTLTSDGDIVLVDGACWHALMIRAASRVETINLNKDVSDNYRDITAHFQNAFLNGLAVFARRRMAVGEPDRRAWNDEYHGWSQ